MYLEFAFGMGLSDTIRFFSQVATSARFILLQIFFSRFQPIATTGLRLKFISLI